MPVPTLSHLAGPDPRLLPHPHAAQLERARTASALWRLTKPGLAAFSVLSAMAGYATAGTSPGHGHALVAILGIALAAAGALSLNQWWERDFDARMERTRTRPLPSGAIKPATALAFSLFLSAAALALLAAAVNSLSALLAASIIVLYGCAYTPLKRRTRWATEVGSLSGALPPILGAAAAGNPLSPPAWILAAILLAWQMPHFYAIGWRYRDDYRAAGFRLLPAIDLDGARTAHWSFGYTVLFALLAVGPWLAGWLGHTYGVTALLASLLLLHRAWRFLRPGPGGERAARPLFLTSVMILPPLMAALVIDRWLG